MKKESNLVDKIPRALARGSLSVFNCSLNMNLDLNYVMKKILLNIKKNPVIYLIPLLLTILVFRKYIFYELLPIPADIFPGLYFPWFDYKWGYQTPVPVQNAAISDVVSILYPWRILAFRLLQEGTIPLWDPTILLGTPLLANFQTAFFNPVNILFLFMKEYHAWSWGIVLQPLFTIYTTYLFLRSLKLDKTPSVFGAILFAYSNYSIVWMEYNSINYTVALFPLVLYLAAKIAEEINLKWFLLLSLTVFLQIVSGYPQNVIYTLLIALVYFLYRIRVQRERLKKIFIMTCAIIFGLLLSSIQVFPAVELLNLSIRNFDNVASAGNVKYLPLNNLITILFPDYFGNPGRWNYFGSGSYDNFAFAISSVGMYFAILSLLIKSKHQDKYAFFLPLLIIVLIYSTKNPISELLDSVNLIGSSAGSNSRILFVASFIFSVLASYGIQISLENRLKIKNVVLPSVIYLFILFVHIFFLFNKTGNLNEMIGLVTNRVQIGGEDVKDLIVSIRNMVLPSLLTMVISASVITRKRSFTVTASIVCLFVSIILATDKYLPFVKKDLLYPKTEVGNFLLENTKYSRFEKEDNNLIFPSNSWSLLGLSAVSGQNASGLLSISRYLSLINYGGVNDEIMTRYHNVNNFNSPLISTLNISHYAAINWLNDSPDVNGKPNSWLIPENFNEVENIKTVRIYKNSANLGLAWFPDIVRCEMQDEKILEELVDDTYDPKGLVYVNCEDGKFEGSGTVEVDEYTANDMRFTVNAVSDSYLVVSSAYYPGWKASIDGSKGKGVNKANSALIAVSVPSGEHIVEIYYDPISFKSGAVVSGISFIIWLGLLFTKIGPNRANF